MLTPEDKQRMLAAVERARCAIEEARAILGADVVAPEGIEPPEHLTHLDLAYALKWTRKASETARRIPVAIGVA